MIPEGLPTLAKGSHKPEEGKACVMEYVSVLAGEEWTDMPTCTHPFLAVVAQHTNDSLADDERQALIPLIGRLFNTNPYPVSSTQGHRLRCLLFLHLVKQVMPWSQNGNRALREYEDALFGRAEYRGLPYAPPHSHEQEALFCLNEVVKMRNDDMRHLVARVFLNSSCRLRDVRVLKEMLDEYDRLTGRTEVIEVSEDTLRELVEHVRAGAV
jgi:hypothetical protein